MSQRRLSEVSGIPRSTLSKIIGTDEKPVDVNELESLCNALGVSPDMLVSDAWKNLNQDEYVLAAKKQTCPRSGIEDYQ